MDDLASICDNDSTYTSFYAPTSRHSQLCHQYIKNRPLRVQLASIKQIRKNNAICYILLAYITTSKIINGQQLGFKEMEKL